MDLFCATIIELEEELRSCGCGIVLVDSHGQPHRIALLAFADDLVLFANSAAELQRALDIVAKWARRIRMRLNIGVTKSAYMCFGRGNPPQSETATTLVLDGVPLPKVNVYKYLGVCIGSGGGDVKHLQLMCSKAATKTWEIASWAHHHNATVDIATRLWHLYTSRALLYGSALLSAAPTTIAMLCSTQRVCGRILLGFSKTSPCPSVLAELGWLPFTIHVDNERLRLFCRLLISPNALVHLALDCCAQYDCK